MKKLILSIAIALLGVISAVAAPLVAFTYSAQTTNAAAASADNARVRGVPAAFAVTNSTTNAIKITLASAGTGTFFRASGPIVLFEGVITNQKMMNFTTNYLYQDTIRMTTSNASGVSLTNTSYGVLLIEQ